MTGDHHHANGAHPENPVEPLPLPTAWNLSPAIGMDGQKWLLVKVSSPVGVHVFFVDPNIADQIGDMFKQVGGMARTGLVIPNGN